MLWHDGKPFTADDVVFNWEYAADPATATPRAGTAQELERVERIDAHTVRLVFKRPTPYWATQFCGRGCILPRHVFEPFKGTRSREAPANLRPVGTGPYRIVDFKPGDLIRAELNPHYHVPNRPFFDTLEVKGGGDDVSAARAVLQTGEYDMSPDRRVDDEVLRRLEAGSSKGRVEMTFAGGVAMIQVNQTDPGHEVEGERSSLKAPHPLFTDPAVRQALQLLIDRASIVEHVSGRQSVPTGNMVTAPPQFVLEEHAHGIQRGQGQPGPRRGGVEAGTRRHSREGGQEAQAAPAGGRVRAGPEGPADHQASGGQGGHRDRAQEHPSRRRSSPRTRRNPDTFTHFYADLQLLGYPSAGGPDPEWLLGRFTSWEIPQKHNKWQGQNAPRWRNDEYDRLFRAAQSELDPAKRAALFIRLNDQLVQGGAVIPYARFADVAAIANSLHGVGWSGWDLLFWRLAYWYRQA